MKATFIALALGLTLGFISGPGHTELPDPPAERWTEPRTGAKVQQMTARQFERWRRSELKKLKALMDTKPENVGWSKTRRASRSTVIVLDPPLRKLSGPDKVDVEIFYSYLDELGRGIAFTGTQVLWARWGISLADEAKTSYGMIQRHNQIVGSGPKVPARFARQQRHAQELHYGHEWYRLDPAGDEDTGWRVLEALVYLAQGGGLFSLDSREGLESLLTRHEVSVEEWNRKTSQYVERRISEADSRWARIVEQGSSVYDKAFDGLSDPILLIDGKYLITRNTVARQGGRRAVERVYQTANSLIRHQIERNPRQGFEMQRILWENERKARRGEITELEHAFAVPDPSKIDVEWLYTYISGDGQRNQNEWFEKIFNEWLASVRRGGVWDIKVRRTPVSKMNATGGAWTEHQRTHQRLILAWDENEEMRRGTIHPILKGWMREDPRSLGNVERAKALVEYAGVPVKEWQERMYSSETVERMKTADTKAMAGSGRSQRRRREADVRTPVVVVDGRYLIDRTSAGSVEKLFQILNWMVRLRHQSMTQTGAEK